MKVLLWPIPQHPLLQEGLASLPGIAVEPVSDAASFADRLPGAAAAVMSGREYDAGVAAALLGRPHALQLLQLLTAGYEGPVLHGAPEGLAICNAGDTHSPMVAEHSLALLLALIRHLPTLFEQQRARRWDRAIGGRIGSLDGATLAIIGFGGIGREIARRARPFGCRLLAVTRRARPEPEVDELHALAALPAVLARADAVIVALPLLPATQHLIGAAALAACRPGTLLVNVARGGLVDQAALLEALDSGRIGAAALDVTTPEPLPADSPLWTHPRVMISPHLAGVGSQAARRRLADLVCDNIARLRDGRPLTHRVMGGPPGG